MKKVLFIAFLISVLGVGFVLYAAIGDRFTITDEGGADDVFRVNSSGVVVLDNGESIDNSTDGTISFTDGTNTLWSIVDTGTTGDLSGIRKVIFDNGEEIENITDGDLAFTDGTNDLMILRDTGTSADLVGLSIVEMINGETMENDVDGQINFTDGTNTLMQIIDGGTSGSINVTGIDNGDANIANVGQIALDSLDADGSDISIGDGDETLTVNSSDWDIDPSGIVTGVGDITSDGVIQGAGFRMTGGEAITASTILVSSDSGNLFAVTANGVTMTLPEGVTAGNVYTIVAFTSSQVNIDPTGTDTIIYSPSGNSLAGGDRLLSAASATGTSVTLACDGNGGWFVTAINGTWTDND